MYNDYTNPSDVDEVENTLDDELNQNESNSSEQTYAEWIGRVANCEKVYLRENPDMSENQEKKILEKGVELFVTGEVNEWFEVTLANGYEGYIKKEFVAIEG